MTVTKRELYMLYRSEAAVLELLSSDPVNTSAEMRVVDADELSCACKRSYDKRRQPQWSRVVRLAECAVRPVTVTVRQLSLVAWQPYRIL